MKRNIIYLVLIAISFSSCAINRMLESQEKKAIGKNESFLRRTVGPPDTILDNAAEGKIWVYIENERAVDRSESIEIAADGKLKTITKSSPYLYTNYTKYWLDTSGNVYNATTTKINVKKVIAYTSLSSALCITGIILAGLFLMP